MGLSNMHEQNTKWGFNRRGSVDNINPESSQVRAMTTDASCNMRNADLLQGTKLLHETGAVSEQASKEAVGPPSGCSKTQGPEQPYLVLELPLFEQEIGLETVEVVPTFFFSVIFVP